MTNVSLMKFINFTGIHAVFIQPKIIPCRRNFFKYWFSNMDCERLFALDLMVVSKKNV